MEISYGLRGLLRSLINVGTPKKFAEAKIKTQDLETH
jgi:hypothetical protein